MQKFLGEVLWPGLCRRADEIIITVPSGLKPRGKLQQASKALHQPCSLQRQSTPVQSLGLQWQRAITEKMLKHLIHVQKMICPVSLPNAKHTKLSCGSSPGEGNAWRSY
ncbi:unnamed protein product [Eretmochelys imbricata]